MDKVMVFLKLLKTWGPLISVILLGGKTLAEKAGQQEVAQFLGLLMSVLGLGIFDPETSAATLATAGGAYKLWLKLKPAQGPA